MALIWDSINTNDAIKRYLAGESEKSVAKSLHVDRGSIRRMLIRNGVKRRNRSESMFTRMSFASPEERQAISKAAHDAVRGMKRTKNELIRRALTRQIGGQYIGRGEKELNQWLIERGLETIPQMAVNSCNIDIAIPPVAVELLITSSDPMKRFYDRKKIEYLCTHGWNVLYIHIARLEYLSEKHADYIRTYIDLVRADPSIIGEYRMIGRNADMIALRRFNTD